jgi:hypothetical protein
LRVYLALSATDLSAPVPKRLLAVAREAVHEAFPVPAEAISAAEWISPDGGVALLAWSNEPEHELLPPPLRAGHGRVLGYCGYLAEPSEDEGLLLGADDLAAAAERPGGVFSVFRAGPEGVEAATSITRVNPVYHAQAAGLCLVGSRALLVHLTARAAQTGSSRPQVDLDVQALQPLVRHGFFANDETPFRGVTALPNAATLIARRGEPVQVKEARFPEPGPAPANAREAGERVAGLARALRAAVRPLARHGEPVALALSGGRDSRLMAAVLHSAGIPVTARTHGFADDPDVVLATRIARTLGMEHQVGLAVREQQLQEAVLVQHPLARAHHVIRMCEGMNSAYERVGGWAPYEMEPRTSGSGGETLRGGFLYDQGDLTPAGIQKRVRTIFYSAESFLTPEANRRAAGALEMWGERARGDGFGALDKLYLFYRTGRWIVGSHSATLMNSPFYHPFFDNRVVREALALPAEWRSSEEVVFRLIETLTPQLRGIPPEGRRWRFETSRPRRLTEYRAWRSRAAMLPVGRTAGFNWRKSYDEEFLAILRDQVMRGPRELFDIVDEARAKEHFARPPTGWHNQTWHIYTLSVLLSRSWREPLPDLPQVRIPIPS